MTIKDTATQVEQFVLANWHTFRGGVVIGALAVMLLEWLL